jgi:hypothetical protein
VKQLDERRYFLSKRFAITAKMGLTDPWMWRVNTERPYAVSFSVEPGRDALLKVFFWTVFHPCSFFGTTSFSMT